MTQNQKWRHLLAFWLAVSLLLNPLAGVAAAAEEVSSKGIFQRSLSYFGSMFIRTDLADAPGDPGQELGDLADEGLLDPFLDLFGRHFGGLLKDERFKEALGKVLDDILADERIAAFDAAEFTAAVLRDERLAVIFGEVIADYLRDEDLLTFIEQLGADIKKLLKDERFISYLNNTLTGLATDERINELFSELIGAFMDLPKTLMLNLQDEEAVKAINGFVEDVLKIFMEPLEKFKNDERVAGSIGNIIRYIAGDETDPATYPGLAALLAGRLADDEDFQEAKEQLMAIFTKPLLGDPDSPDDYPGLLAMLAYNLQQDKGLSLLLDQLKEELKKDHLLGPVLEQLSDELEQLTTGISDNIFKAIDFYSGGIPLPETEPGAPSTSTKVRLEVAAEDIVGDFLMHWMDCLVWVIGQSGGLDSIMEPYVGENSQYMAAIKKALLDAVDEEGTVLLQMFDIYLGAVDPEEIMAGVMEQWGDLLEGAVDDAIAGVSGEDSDYTMIKKLVMELPFDTVNIAELIDIRAISHKLFDLVDKQLPLDALVPHLRENADELGYNIATTLLGRLADLVEAPPEPEDPRRTEIMAALRSEERLRQFYLDLGGSQPEKITAESSDLAIILEVIKEIAGDEDRLARFTDELNYRPADKRVFPNSA